jgi:hypothetical protein
LQMAGDWRTIRKSNHNDGYLNMGNAACQRIPSTFCNSSQGARSSPQM